ncbi:MAG: hypothetical protein LBS25_09485 [Candidatus Symbiothrix sp.]|jgi:hypothetical protein|nr:hypothetical protein [Candidatus Symbiothrix sp.]
MKGLLQKCFFTMLMLAVSLLPACIDENASADMGNLGINTGVELPILKGTTANLGDLLKKVKSPTDEVTIDYMDVDVDRDGSIDYQDVVTVFYENGGKPFSLDEINADFDTLQQKMATLRIPNLDFTVNPIQELTEQEFEFWDIIPNSLIDHIEFTNVELSIVIAETDIYVATHDFCNLYLKIPILGAEDYIVETINLQDWVRDRVVPLSRTTFTLDAKRKILLGGVIISDGQTTGGDVTFEVNIKTNLDNGGKFTVWGWFNYILASDQMEATGIKDEVFPANIQQYLSDGTTLIFNDPRCQFHIESTLGVPLEFTMKELTHTSAGSEVIHITGDNNNGYTYNLAAMKEIPMDTIFEMNKTYPFNTADQTKYESLFATNLESLALKYRVITQPLDTASLKPDQTPTFKNGGEAPIQFLSSDSYLKVGGQATLPLILSKGSKLAYKEELVDLTGSDESQTEEDGFLDQIEEGEAKFYLCYKNKLPLAMHTNIIFYKKDKTTEVTRFEIDITPTQNEEWAQESLEVTKDNVNDLKGAKYMTVEFWTDEIGDEPVAFTKNDSISVKFAIGASVTANLNDLLNK